MAEPPHLDGPDLAYDWQLAGYLEAGKDYAEGYHNFDPDSPQERFSVESFGDWEFLPDADYVVVKVTVDSEDYYVTLAGPFDDEEELYDAVVDWWETGS